MKVIKVLAISFIGLNVLDILLTWLRPNEFNPVMRLLINQSWDLAWSVKLVAIALCTLGLFQLAVKYPKQLRTLFTVLVTGMSAICLVNTIALVV